MAHQQSGRTLQTRITTRAVDVVLADAKDFFARRNSVYTAFLEKEGPGYVALRGQGGEEIVVGAREDRGITRVTASSYMFDAQVARFLSSLPEADEPAETPAAPDEAVAS